MISATAWNNGAHHRSGAGYGLSVDASDRDVFFRRDWGMVRIRIGDAQPFAANIDKDSLWDGSCMHLISIEIGRWMRAIGLAPWAPNPPPRFLLVPLEPGFFEIRTTIPSA
jgi:hypothetical protein